MPPDRVDQPVDVFQELPGKTGLADARRADDGHEAGAALARGGVEQVLEKAQLIAATHEWGLECLGAPAPTDLGNHPQGPPGGNRARLALQEPLPGRIEDDGP